MRIASALTKPVITARHEAHHIAQTEQPGSDLDEPCKNRGGQEILKPMLLDQGHHQHGGCRGGRRNHAGTAAGDGDDHCDREGGVESDLRIDAGDDGKGDGFGDERQRDDQTREDVAANVAEPLIAVSGKRMHKESIENTKPLGSDDPFKVHDWRLRCPADRRPEEPPGFSPGPIE
jgi:hypothetical protein